MRYQVFVELLDGTGRIDLADTSDPQSAADLVYGLTVAGSGKGFNIGIAITPGDQTTPEGAQRQGQQQQQQNRPPARGPHRQ